MDMLKNNLIIFGAEYLIFFLLLLFALFLWKQPRRKQNEIVLFILITFPLTYVTAKISSLFFYNTRPFVVGNFAPLVEHVADNGFPSDHMLLSSAVAVAVLFYNKRIGFIFLGLALIVGLARVLAGVHHLTDVFGSLAIATIVAVLIRRFIFPMAVKSSLYKRYV